MDKSLYFHSKIKSHRNWPITLNTYKPKHSYRGSIKSISPMSRLNAENTTIPIRLPNIKRTSHLSFFDKISNEHTKLCLTGCKKRIEEKYLKSTPRPNKVNAIKTIREIALSTDFIDDSDLEYFID